MSRAKFLEGKTIEDVIEKLNPYQFVTPLLSQNLGILCASSVSRAFSMGKIKGEKINGRSAILYKDSFIDYIKCMIERRDKSRKIKAKYKNKQNSNVKSEMSFYFIDECSVVKLIEFFNLLLQKGSLSLSISK